MPTVTVIQPTISEEQNHKLRCAAYCRVSSNSEDQINSFMAQTRYYEKAFAKSDREQLVDIYADEGITGTREDKRDGFQRMMSEITAGQIIQWQNEMQTKGFSEAYLRMIQNQLTSLFTHASRIYDLHTNPCKKVKRMGSSDNRSLDFWTVDEYQKFIQTMEPGSRYYLIFEILFWTGCRIG